MKTLGILPVKRLDQAFGRLEGVLEPKERARLAEAMFLDALGTLRQSRVLDDIVVVTSDPAVARQARWLGSRLVEQSEDTGHAPAASLGAKAAIEMGADRVAMLPTDCPLMEASEIDEHLGRSPRAALIVPDRHGTGTNALVLNPPDAFQPAFGPESCARHISRARAAGISFALEELQSLSLDLDTPEDLYELRDALLLAPERALRSAQVLWELGADEPLPSTDPSREAAA
jgi:2-phospho-L-lactate/phosphoenolpyruvate guanylyltransferase